MASRRRRVRTGRWGRESQKIYKASDERPVFGKNLNAGKGNDCVRTAKGQGFETIRGLGGGRRGEIMGMRWGGGGPKMVAAPRKNNLDGKRYKRCWLGPEYKHNQKETRR